ncbi:MAG: CHAD domain-containing protein [Deltaproteobacteria bacterium]|nr:CHAD domain-containing protein [Deltaproteobacteria bacterium]MBV8454341.1 CHAD domain-containing protein [Deltaproteobacteria bacterium]
MRTQKELSKDVIHYAAKLLRKLNKTFQNVIERKDSEGVHDFRKITRDLQSLISACDVKQHVPKTKKIRRDLQSWRHALSAWRDADVMVESVKQARQKAHHTYEQDIWPAVVERTTKQRNRALKKFLKSADFQKMDKLRKNIRGFVKSRAKAEPMADNLSYLLEQGWQKLDFAIGEFERAAIAANLHAVRIKVKTLRYALNLRQRFYPDKRLEDSSVWLKGLQDRIGGWHDELTLSELVRATLSESNTIVDPKRAEVVEGIKEKEITMAESARNYLLSMREKQEYKRLRRVLSAAIYATAKSDDAKAAAQQSAIGLMQ